MKLFDLTGKVCIVTGGNGGIGLTYAKGLVKAGAQVAIWGRNASKNATAIQALEALAGAVGSFTADLTDEGQTKRAFEATNQLEGVAVFLASRHSDFMTGQGIVLDGGHSIFPM